MVIIRFFDLLYVIILGIVEGITEWLPISSTAHLLLFEEMLVPLKNPLIFNDSFLEVFNVLIQLGAVIAVIVVYYKKLIPTKKDLRLSFWFKILVATIPSIIVGLLFDDYIDMLFYNMASIAIVLIFYGIIFIIVDRNLKKNPRYTINYCGIKVMFLIGCFQALAVIPGTSRSGITIITALALGFSRTDSADLSFYLSIPVMLGASILKIVKFNQVNVFLNSQIILLALGMICAFVISVLVVKFLIRFVKKHGFLGFGYYRIIIGIIILIRCLLS